MFCKIEAYFRLEKLEEVRQALLRIGVPAVDSVMVQGLGRQTDIRLAGRHGSYSVDTLPRLRMNLVVGYEDAGSVAAAIRWAAATGSQGDGAIFVSPVENVIRISTGEAGRDVLTFEGDIDIQAINSPPPDLSDLLALYLDRKDRAELDEP